MPEQTDDTKKVDQNFCCRLLIFFLVYVVMRSVLWKVFALWNYLGSYNNLSFLFFFFFLKRLRGGRRGSIGQHFQHFISQWWQQWQYMKM